MMMIDDRWFRNRRHALRSVAVLSVMGLAVASCGSDASADADSAIADTTVETVQTNEAEDHDDEDHDDEDHDEEYEFGTPMEAADASRVIAIKAHDDFTFDPASVTVTAGEIVTFRVENVGVIPHDFTLGDTHLQDEHEEEMAAMSTDEMVMHDEPNAFSLEAGETKEMTWQFTEAGGILYGCHTPGHYPAGMKGDITIDE
jgi:uncharacterized cupredoxin-like copper-binding protein